VTHEVAVLSVVPAHISAAGFAIDDTEVYPDERALDNGLWRFDAEHDARNQMTRALLRAVAAAAAPAASAASAATAHAGLQQDGSQGGRS